MNSSPDSVLLRPTGRLAPAFPSLGRQPVQVPSVPQPHGGSAPARAHGQAMTLAQSYAHEMSTLREQATAGGYQDGYAKGMAGANAAIAETTAVATAAAGREQAVWTARVSQAVDALAAAAARLDQRSVPALAELTRTLTSTALDLTSAILARELVTAKDPGLDAIRRALTLCPADAPVRVSLHPEDLARLDQVRMTALSELITVSADPNVEPGGALVESGARRVDAQLGTAMIRVRKALES